MGGYARLNLRFNPFGELPDEDRARVAVVDTAALARHLEAPRAALQLVGRSGRGKTTRLLALRTHLGDAAQFVRVDHDGTADAPTGRIEILLLDRFELATRKTARALLRSADKVALSLHKRATWRLMRYGFHPVVVHVGFTAAEAPTAHLADLFARRLAFARNGPGAVPVVTDEAVAALTRRYGDNIRAMEDTLFDVVAGLDETGPMQILPHHIDGAEAHKH